jgi:hypothetical protein
LCFEKFCDFSSFFKEKSQQLTLTFFPTILWKDWSPKKFWIAETLFLNFFTNIYEPNHFLVSYFKTRVKGLVKLFFGPNLW